MGKLSAENALRLVTHNVIPRPYLETVVERALHPTAAGSGTHKRLRRLLRRCVEIPSCDDPWHAPAQERLQATLDAVETSAPLWRAVLRAWASSQATLGVLVATHIEERYGPGGVPGGGWTPDALRAAVDAVRESVPGLAHNDVALMLCWLTGYVPLPNDAPDAAGAQPIPDAPRSQTDPPKVEDPAPANTLPVRWHGSAAHWQALFAEVLEGLRQMAADSPVWEAVTRFADSLRQIVEEKAAERQGARERLRRALDALRQETDADPGYFAFTDLAHWRAEDAPLHRVPDLVATADALRQHLRRHRRLRRVVPSSINEGLVQRMRLQTLESAALDAHARLAETLGSGRAIPQGAPPAASAPPDAPRKGTPSHEETPPGADSVLEIIVEEEAPATPHTADERADAASADEGMPSGADQPTAAGQIPPEPSPEERAVAVEAPPIPPDAPPDAPVPEAPTLPPAPGQEEPEQAEDAPPAPSVAAEPMPEPPTLERPADPPDRPEAEVPEAPTVPPGEPPDDVTPPTVSPTAPAGGEGQSCAPPPSPSVPAAGLAAPDAVTQGSWFSALAHWEPLARDVRSGRRLYSSGPHPRSGLRRVFGQARRFFERLFFRSA